MADKKRSGRVVTTRRGLYQAVVELADGSLKRITPPFPKGTSLAYAKERALYWQHQSDEKGWRRPTRPEQPSEPHKSGSKWWSDFLAHRDSLGLTRVTGHYDLHIKPVTAAHPSTWTAKTCKDVRDSLDVRVAAGEISAKTAFNAWAVWTTACKAASGKWKKDKRETLKVREDNPCVDIAPPDIDDPKDLQWLYPDEFSRLVSCRSVPLEWRARYILATVLYLRGSELAALRWSDLDLERGIAKIRFSFDQDQKAIKGTKTGNKGNRRFAIEPVLLPLLRALRGDKDESEHVVSMPHRRFWAARLREHLTLAGVKRAELFTTDKTSKQLRFHDLRSTGLTWLAIRGDDPLKIQQRAGHTDFQTTQKYVRVAEDVEGAIGPATVFPALPDPISFLIAETQPIEIRREDRASLPVRISETAGFSGKPIESQPFERHDSIDNHAESVVRDHACDRDGPRSRAFRAASWLQLSRAVLHTW